MVSHETPSTYARHLDRLKPARNAYLSYERAIARRAHAFVVHTRLHADEMAKYEEIDVEDKSGKVSDVVVFSYGITSRVAMRGIELARAKGVKVGLHRPQVVWPFPETRIRQLAASLPLDALVLESDAPDIPPAWAPRQRNEPANVVHVAAKVAEVWGLPIEEVAALTTANARRLFRLPP